jgi:hypothetical protein
VEDSELSAGRRGFALPISHDLRCGKTARSPARITGAPHAACCFDPIPRSCSGQAEVLLHPFFGFAGRHGRRYGWLDRAMRIMLAAREPSAWRVERSFKRSVHNGELERIAIRAVQAGNDRKHGQPPAAKEAGTLAQHPIGPARDLGEAT